MSRGLKGMASPSLIRQQQSQQSRQTSKLIISIKKEIVVTLSLSVRLSNERKKIFDVATCFTL